MEGIELGDVGDEPVEEEIRAPAEDAALIDRREYGPERSGCGGRAYLKKEK